MRYEEFEDRFLNNLEEFNLKYKNFIIEILNYKDGFACYICDDYDDKGILYAIKNRNSYLNRYVYHSPKELLENFRIDNKLLKEIWNEIES